MCKPTTLPYYPTEQALLKVIASAGPTASCLDDASAMETEKEIGALHGKLNELEQKLLTSSELFLVNPSEAGTKILQQLELEKKSIATQLEDKRNSVFLADHRADWKEVKGRIEADLEKAGAIPFEVIPVSVKGTNGKLDFVRHRSTRNEGDIIALRESLRSYIDRIDIDIPNMVATICFKSGEEVIMEFKKTHSYPRRYFYRTAKTDWIPLKQEPNE
jgi:hypothetical protein